MVFAQLLEGLTVDNAKEIRAQVEDLPAESSEFIEFHYAWGKIGGVDAIMHGADTQKPDMAATIAGYASADPAEALQWFNSLDAEGGDSFASQDYLKRGLVHGLANTNMDLATSFVLERAAAGDDSAVGMLGIVTSKMLRSEGVVEAAVWAGTLPEGDMRNSAMGRVAYGYAQEDPQAAAAWAVQLGNDESAGRVVGAISSESSRRDAKPPSPGWTPLAIRPRRHTALLSRDGRPRIRPLRAHTLRPCRIRPPGTRPSLALSIAIAGKIPFLLLFGPSPLLLKKPAWKRSPAPARRGRGKMPPLPRNGLSPRVSRKSSSKPSFIPLAIVGGTVETLCWRFRSRFFNNHQEQGTDQPSERGEKPGLDRYY